MYTLKFQSWDENHPLFKGAEHEKLAKRYSLKEGTDITHRRFQVDSVEELEAWKQEYGWGAVDVNSYMAGYDLHAALVERRANKKMPAKGTYLDFIYLTFIDQAVVLWRCIIFGANVYIMNGAGQTVETISM